MTSRHTEMTSDASRYIRVLWEKNNNVNNVNVLRGTTIPPFNHHSVFLSRLMVLLFVANSYSRTPSRGASEVRQRPLASAPRPSPRGPRRGQGAPCPPLPRPRGGRWTTRWLSARCRRRRREGRGASRTSGEQPRAQGYGGPRRNTLLVENR